MRFGLSCSGRCRARVKTPSFNCRVYFVRINLEGKSEGPNEATPAPLSAVVSPGVLGLILALSAQVLPCRGEP